MNELKAVAAGFLIGLGVIINTLSAQPVLGAFFFSFGLLTIIDLQLPLYTGRIGFFFDKKHKLDFIKILFYNFIGIIFCLSLFFIKDPAFMQTIINKSIIKFDKSFLQIFIDGFFCGTLIHFAVKCKKKIITILAIMIFILMGAEHCIADFPYFMVNITMINLIKFLTIIIGNSCGAIFIESMLKKKGN